MRKYGLTAAAALIAAALPFAVATDAMAQAKVAPGGGGARSAPAMPGGGGGVKSGGVIGGGAAIGGGGGRAFRGGTVGGGQRWAGSGGGGQRWAGHRGGWHGGHGHRGHRGSYWGPGLGIGIGTGLLLGGAYAASPYYYDEPYGYQSYPYDEGYVVQGATAAPDEVAYCQQRYRSYDVRTGTYLNNDGNRYPCP